MFWIGKDGVGIPDGLRNPPYLSYRYKVIDVKTLDPAPLLASENLSEVVFAILCKYRNASAMVDAIMKRIRQAPAEERRDAVSHPLVLSGMRDLAPLVRRKVKQMPLEIPVKDNQFPREVWDEAAAEGRAEGRAKGRAEGKAEAMKSALPEAQQVLLDLVRMKFGAAAVRTYRSRILKADLATVQAWSRAAIASSDAAEVFS